MKILLLSLSLLALLPSRLPADVTQTVQVAGFAINTGDFVLTQSKGYVHVLFDTYPTHALLDTAAKRQTVVLGILKDQLGEKFAKNKRAKVDVVQFTARDSYGAPDWSSLIKQEHFEAVKDKKGRWKAEAAKP